MGFPLWFLLRLDCCWHVYEPEVYSTNRTKIGSTTCELEGSGPACDDCLYGVRPGVDWSAALRTTRAMIPCSMPLLGST